MSLRRALSRGARAAFATFDAAPTRTCGLSSTRALSRAHNTASASTSTSEDAPIGQVDAREKAKFESDAALWWNEDEGPFAALHAMNPVRVRFIRDALTRRFEKELAQNPPYAALRGVKILDVGCGGGILAESLARLGADVTAIDAGAANIAIARAHAALDPDLAKNLRYEAVTAEELASCGETFDCVTSLEVIEHVTDPLEFTLSLSKLVKPSGSLFISTINRTARSFAMAILAAERILGIVPPGTHQFTKFLTPGEVAVMASRAECDMKELAGMVYDPLRNKWSLSSDTQINFIAHCVKETPP